MLSGTGQFACEPAGEVEAPLQDLGLLCRSREFSHYSVTH